MPRKTSANGDHPEGEELPLAVFMDRDPELYAKIVKFLEEGHSPAGAAALARAPLARVRQIRAILGESAVLAGIRGVARNLLEASQNMAERLVDESGEIPIHLLPSALGTIVDRASLLHGNPTAIIQHAHAAKNIPTPEQLAEMFNALPLAQAITLDPTPTEIKTLDLTPGAKMKTLDPTPDAPKARL